MLGAKDNMQANRVKLNKYWHELGQYLNYLTDRSPETSTKRLEAKKKREAKAEKQRLEDEEKVRADQSTRNAVPKKS